MNLKETIKSVFSDKKAKKEGLHVNHITRHIFNLQTNLFFVEDELNFDSMKKKVIRILSNDVMKKKGSLFARVKNPKTNKFRRGIYRLKNVR